MVADAAKGSPTACNHWHTACLVSYGPIPRAGRSGVLAMQIGVFIPIGNNGWLISTAAPQYLPTFDLNKEIVQKAERYNWKIRAVSGITSPRC